MNDALGAFIMFLGNLRVLSMKAPSQAKRSPLKAPPLRQPGQSLNWQITDMIFGKMFIAMTTSLFMIFMAGYEWYRYFKPTKPFPILLTCLAILSCLISFGVIRRQLPKLRQLQLGLNGERSVGQKLERLRSLGYEVFHDIVGNGFNVDHALVGPSGVYAIETKTISKPVKGKPEVTVRNDVVTVAGYKPDRDPIEQAKASADHLAHIIRETSGIELKVNPVVIYPGWFVRNGTTPSAWVSNDLAFLKVMQKKRPKLSDYEISMLSAAISMHIRNTKTDS